LRRWFLKLALGFLLTSNLGGPSLAGFGGSRKRSRMTIAATENRMIGIITNAPTSMIVSIMLRLDSAAALFLWWRPLGGDVSGSTSNEASPEVVDGVSQGARSSVTPVPGAGGD